jgi:hypothetical protein
LAARDEQLDPTMLIKTGDPQDTKRMWMWVGGAFLFVCALVIRLLLIKDARFTGDEAHFFQVAQNIAHGRSFPVLGPMLTGGSARHPGAAFFYLMSISQFLSRAPEMANALVAFLGACGVVFVFLAWLPFFGGRAAWLSGLLLAFSPWAVLFSDRIWNSNVFTFVVALALLCASKIREGKDPRWWVVFFPVCAVMPQFHLSAPVVWAALLVLVFAPLKKAPRAVLVLGILASACLYVPYLVHELRSGFANLNGFLGEMPTGAGREAKAFLYAPLYVIRFLTLDVTYHQLTGYWGGLDETRALRMVAASLRRVPSSFSAFALWVSILGAASAAAMLLVGPRPDARSVEEASHLKAFALAAVVAVVADMAFLAVSGKKVFAHYVQPILPFVFVLYPAALARIRGSTRAWLGVFCAVAIFAAGGAQSVVGVNRTVDARHGIRVKRAVLDHLFALRAAENAAAGESISLSFSFHAGHHYSYSILAHHGLGRRLHFDNNASRWRFRVQLSGEAPPSNLMPQSAVFSTGPLKVYRLAAKAASPQGQRR